MKSAAFWAWAAASKFGLGCRLGVGFCRVLGGEIRGTSTWILREDWVADLAVWAWFLAWLWGFLVKVLAWVLGLVVGVSAL